MTIVTIMLDRPEPVTSAPPPSDLPTGLLARLATVVVRRRRAVLALTLIAAVLAVWAAAGTPDKLHNGGYIPQDSQAEQAARFLAAEFDAGSADLVVILTATGPVDDAATAERGALLTRLVDDRADVASVESYWPAGVPALRSHDGRSALMLIRLDGDEDRRQAAADEVYAALTAQAGGLTLQATGESRVNADIIAQSEKDLTRAELLGAPLTVIILLVVFGALVSAMMPAVVGGLAVVGALAVLNVLADTADVSVFALNVTTALGFGLAVDYSLFIVNRYREELTAGRSTEDAIVVAVATAGRTVIFSACTVALSLTALLVYPLFFLRSIAYAAILVVAFGALVSVLVLPALLAVLGPRLFAGTMPWARRARHANPNGGWHRLAALVMRRPLVTAGPVVVVLVLLALPFLGVKFGLADSRVLPDSAPAAQAAAVLDRDFDRAALDAVTVAVPGAGIAALRDDDGYPAQLSRLPHVRHVDSALGRYRDGALVTPANDLFARMSTERDSYVTLTLDVAAHSSAAQDVVRQARKVPPPEPGATPLVGGPTATLVDTSAVMSDRLPWAIAIIGVSTFVLLFLFTGSLIMPLKALVLNLLSLTATFGAMVYIFQDGHLRWLVGDFTPTGYLEVTIPVLVFCIAFGLSMDYEVFMLSRIREEYLRHGDNARAVARGLERTGRLITAAALVVASVLIALATSELSMLKLLGVALTMAVITDAVLVRGILVPAFMRLAGSWNWWAPGPLARLHARIGLRD